MNERSLRQADLPQLLQLWNRNATFDELYESLLQEKIWGDSDYCEQLGMLVEESGLPVAMAMGVIRTRNEERHGYIKMLVVNTPQQHQGLATRLVQRLEQLLWQAEVSHIRVGESAPNYLFPGIDARYASALQLFESLGYQRIGETYNMTVDLANSTGDNPPVMSAPVECRSAHATDEPAITRLIQQHWPAWQQEVAVALGNDPPSLHLAFAGGQTVGFAAYDSNNRGTGWFGPMGTDPDFQGQHIGKALLHRCLNDIQAQGHQQAIIPWVGPREFYSRHAGAIVDRTFYRYEKQRSSNPA